MKENVLAIVCAAFLLTSCDTYTGMGAYTGASLGSVLGSAIGGLSNGPRGSDWGTIVGMAGGAAVGASLGSVADAKVERQRQDDMYRYQSDKAARARKRAKKQKQQEENYWKEDSGYDERQSGDDRIYDMGIPGPNE